MEKTELIHVIFSTHARLWCREFQLPLKTAVWMVYHSEKEEAPPDRYKKFPKAPNIRYYRNGTIIFTVARIAERITREPVDLVLSVYDQEMDLPGNNL